jgi:acetyl/propionyl-CoA carboxylase alpha subunit
MDVFHEMGIEHYGILLSEKDSVTYANALAPELRTLTDPQRVHRVPDYSGATKEERKARVAQIVQIARRCDYNSIFAGYGFMSEDADMVSAIERAGLTFIGPSSRVQAAAGLKDEAKRTALRTGVSVTPGVDNATTRALLKRAPTADDLLKLAERYGLGLSLSEIEALTEDAREPSSLAGIILERGHAAGIDLYTVEEVIEALREGVRELFHARPSSRVRLKAISGGGGKGQRILRAPASYMELESKEAQVEAALSPLPGLMREVLSEVKCLGVGDNKNVVAELNIEQTSHQEIQVVGNGEWCMTLGGRDCSLQMHEQKLLEISVTEEELLTQIAAQPEGSSARRSLGHALQTLRKMEEEASRFGSAVGLDSVSTFECIVSDDEHYFMEMNTRIQVEHRVTELCYSLLFTDPEKPSEFFTVTSLVELMVLLARHGSTLPKPTRLPRCGASVEARINATNDALKPHAGGVIQEWSAPLEGEVRDDQGISSPNPDTGTFMRYHLAGAYDSNIALLLTVGKSRRESYERMAEVLRLTKMKGDQLCTNLYFHYGLIQWLLTRDVYCRPNTKFVAQYLAGVGALHQEVNQISIDVAWRELTKRAATEMQVADLDAQSAISVFEARSTLVMRPLRILLREPHLFAGWLSTVNAQFSWRDDGGIRWLVNPLRVLSGLYQLLNLEQRAGRPALQQIWDHDESLLKCGLEFYQDLESSLDESYDWPDLDDLLKREMFFVKISQEVWDACRASHRGHQAGLEVLSLLIKLGARAKFFELVVGDDGLVRVPDEWCDAERQAELIQALAPPPVARSGELVAVSGGMFYPREAPDQPKLIEMGEHFEEGQPLYIIEVMKMFNKVYAPFSGTITEVLIEGEGCIIKKGQPLFKVKPDQELIEVDHDEERRRQIEVTRQLLSELT